MPKVKYYEPLNISRIECELADMFYSKAFNEEEEEYPFTARQRSLEQIEDLIADPNSEYHKILDGYTYYVHMNNTIITGAGGCRYIYKSMLIEGMTEEELMSIIYVRLGEKDYALNTLKIIENEF